MNENERKTILMRIKNMMSNIEACDTCLLEFHAILNDFWEAQIELRLNCEDCEHRVEEFFQRKFDEERGK